jgi:hypothetical protein
MRTQTIVWTALPNGTDALRRVNLSVFVSPQLQTDQDGANPSLVPFTDWVNWVTTLQEQPTPFSFNVTFSGFPPVNVVPDLSGLSSAHWAAIFDPAMTGVTPYSYTDYSTTPIHSFDVNAVEQYVQSLYGRLGLASPVTPPVLSTIRGLFGAADPALEEIFLELLDLTACAAQNPTGASTLAPGTPQNPILGIYEKSVIGNNPAPGGLVCALNSLAIGEAISFHTRPPAPTPPSPPSAANAPPLPFVPTLPTLDFHQAVASLGSYPAVLRNLGLVFDLVVPLPKGLKAGTVNVSTVPVWTSSFSGGTTVNVSPATSSQLTASVFRAVPATTDYVDGMLNLADAGTFSVVDLDVDGAAEQLYGLSSALQNIASWVEPQSLDDATMAMTVPALRSIGPSIVWSGWADMGNGLNELASRQTTISNQVAAWAAWEQLPPLLKAFNPEPPLPVLQAEDIIRGHRFDVFNLSDPAARWRSLHERIGSYAFGSESPVALPAASAGGPGGQDEGVVVPGATSAADTAATPSPPDLYVHEAITRWAGWSLAAPRPGLQIDPDDTVHANRDNPAATTTDAAGQITPQLSASFSAAPGTLPKLRFGRRYRYRARAVDLAGNSLSVSVDDAAAATTETPHYRYEPVPSPVMAQTGPLGPGEATMLLAIRNYQTTPATAVTPNGRWLFAPKASELLAEEHGMLDGFVAGSAPDPHAPPNGNTATYTMLAGTGDTNPGRADSTLANVPAVQFDPANNNAFYFAVTADPTTPWLPDPLSRGVTLDGFPGAIVPDVREWEGGPWPSSGPLLLLLQAGALASPVTHSFAPGGAGTSATETVTLAPAAVLDLGISSALTSALTLGVWHWIEAQATTLAQLLELAELAERGQLWMLTPYRVLRLVHAVRLPLVAPSMVAPVVTRSYGSVQANIVDASFLFDAPSSIDIDAEATWTDPLDDPSDPTNDPATSTITSTGQAFKAIVPDPGPLSAVDRPMEVFSPPTTFPVLNAPGVTHTIGDTKHHLVDYTCTASSRFAEFFRASTTVTLTSTAPMTIDPLGLDPNKVVVTSGANTLAPYDGTTGDYIVGPEAGTLALVSGDAYLNQPLDVSYIPADTATGTAFPVQILSTAQPKAPKVARVSPAWAFEGPFGTVEAKGISFTRLGNFVRVYLERPWWSTGAGELLGVVGLDTSLLVGQDLPSDLSPAWVTTMGLDPISVSSLDESFPIVPSAFGATTSVPAVPYRPAYTSPPTLNLVEDPTGTQVQIWPYEVNYDPVSGYWYADIEIAVGSTPLNGPPPGWFVRLALVRFQPYSIEGAEISQVALATFAQPVPERLVSVTANTDDSTNSSVFVSVSGPGYYGWRPPNPKSDVVQVDFDNEYAEHPNSEYPSTGSFNSSTMVVEVEVQDTTTGLAGELAWAPAVGFAPVMLSQFFNGQNEVYWTVASDVLAPEQLPFQLPGPIGSAPMRLRVSELDYYPFRDAGAPAVVNTAFRRPFVCFIPLV